MLSNFKKRFRNAHPEHQPFLSPQPDASSIDSPSETTNVARQQWAAAMADTVYVPGCTCTLCIMRSETENVTEHMSTHSRRHASRSLPSFRSVMEVLYPPPHPAALSPFPDPPSYSRSDSVAYPAAVDDPEVSPLISSAPANIERTPSRSDLLSQDPSLTGVPSSQGAVSDRIILVEPNPPIIDFDAPEEPLPAYTRFDQRRPRFPTASDILGPYPPMSVIRRSAQ